MITLCLAYARDTLIQKLARLDDEAQNIEEIRVWIIRFQ